MRFLKASISTPVGLRFISRICDQFVARCFSPILMLADCLRTVVFYGQACIGARGDLTELPSRRQLSSPPLLDQTLPFRSFPGLDGGRAHGPLLVCAR
jgi:hypothetical protein